MIMLLVGLTVGTVIGFGVAALMERLTEWVKDCPEPEGIYGVLVKDYDYCGNCGARSGGMNKYRVLAQIDDNGNVTYKEDGRKKAAEEWNRRWDG